MTTQEILSQLGIKEKNPCTFTGTQTGFASDGAYHTVHSPIDSSVLGAVQYATAEDYNRVVETAREAFQTWKMVPAPKRGEIIRQIGDALRENKEALGRLVTLEMGKILQEGLGEVQEMIDICDFAVGQSRQLYGLTMHSERPYHRMYEQWHPLGVVGIISAFNFPVAVWSWNTMLAAICGDVTIWKPSEKTPLTAIACMNIIKTVLAENNVPEGVFNVVIGDVDTGKRMAADERVALVSATGSVRMGRAVGETVAKRLGKSLLELGGNNAIIVTENADFNLALPATLFGAVGTCGQRCTSTRRLLIQRSVFDSFKEKLVNAYRSLTSKIGNPLAENTLIGPMIDKAAVAQMQQSLQDARDAGGTVLFGGEVVSGPGFENGQYVVPALVEARNDFEVVQRETFAPILYLIPFDTLEEAVDMHNNVPQGLSSAIFTTNMKESEFFLSHIGSDCGIANVNIGTSGAEIGGAFGGEKETGGGRESGSDAWKAYMRRQTNTLNWSNDLPLAQGISFDV